MTAADEWRSAAGVGPRIFLQDSSVGDIIFEQPTPVERAEQKDLLKLLNNVRRLWIKGALDPSVNRLARLEVAMVESDAVPHPFDSIVELPDHTQRRLPAGQSLATLFDEFGRAMLILGGAGSGKTTTLLELAQELIERAAKDRNQPIPVVFNISTWKGARLQDWLVRELSIRYLVPKKQGHRWLREQRLILLLDGLDEVGSLSQVECVRAINAFVSTTRAGGLAVCSRLEDYAALPVGLRVHAAICLQPLTPSQIEQYLSTSGHQLDALRTAITLDVQLQRLAQSPLMLNVMTLAYDNLSVADLTNVDLDSVEERRKHLFATYVKRMFQRRPRVNAVYPASRTLPLLSWLARRMRERTLADFLIERLQPDWLRTAAERRAYIMASRLLCGAVLGLVLGAILHITWASFLSEVPDPLAEGTEFLKKAGAGLLLGSLNGVLIGLMDIRRFERNGPPAERQGERRVSRLVMEVAGYALPLTLLNWLIVGLVDTVLTGLLFGIPLALVFGLFFRIHGGHRGMSDDVRTVEALHWSWAGLGRSAARGLLGGAAVGVIVAITVHLTAGPAEQDLSAAGGLLAALLTGLLGAVVGAVVGAAFGSLQSRIVTRKNTPNQGIELSLRNALLACVATGPMVAVLLGGAAIPIFSAAQVANTALVGGLFFGMLAGLRAGGFDVIQHYTLRVILWARGYAPLDYARFLDYSASLIFLQRAGGGYLFVHRLLLEHFAQYEGEAGPAPVSAAAEPVPA